MGGVIGSEELFRSAGLDRAPVALKRTLRGAATLPAGSAAASPARLWQRASLPRSGTPAA